MSNYIDRKGNNLNKKILDVEEVTRDESGEIISMKVKIIRDDLPIDVIGTPLNAESMNSILQDKIDENRYQIFDCILTSSEIVQKDYNLLSLPSVVFRNFVLPSRGFCGSNINWTINPSSNSSCYTRVGNNIIIKRLVTDSNIYFTANIFKIYDEVEQKNFTVTVKRFMDDSDNCTIVYKNIDIIPYNVEAEEEDYECEEIVSDTEVVIYNSSPSDVNLLYRIEGNNLYYCVNGVRSLAQ